MKVEWVKGFAEVSLYASNNRCDIKPPNHFARATTTTTLAPPIDTMKAVNSLTYSIKSILNKINRYTSSILESALDQHSPSDSC